MSVASDSTAELPEGERPEPESPKAALPVPYMGWRFDETEEPSDAHAATIDLLAFKPEREGATPGKSESASAPRDWRRIAAAVSLATIVTIGAAVAAVHLGEMRAANAANVAQQALTDRLDAMSSRLESLDANRSHDEIANLRKVLAEIKNSVASTRGVSDGVAQLSARVDRLEKEQGGKLDKLGDRIDRDAANRLTDIAGRLDKLEAKANAAGAHDLSGPVAQLGERLDHLEKDQAARLDKLGERLDHDASNRVADLAARVEKLETKTAAAVATVASASVRSTPAANAAAPKFAPSVSNEMTGSIDRPSPRLRGFYLSEVHNGYAMIESPAGEIEVAPGDMLPGGGRVLRIERHGHEWAVVTTQGQIVAMDY